MKKPITAFLLKMVLLSLMSCREAAETVDHQILVASETKNHNKDTVLYDSLDQISFSRIRRPASGGMYYEFALPESLQDKHYDIVFEGRIRSNLVQSKGSLVFAAFDMHKNQLCWWALPFSPHLVYTNSWNVFKDSLHIPGLINDVRYATIKAFPFLGDSPSELLDMDTLKVTLKKRQEL